MAVPVYKRPVFRQSSPKLDLILNINILKSSPCASPFPHLLHKPLRVISSNTRDFYLFKYLPLVHLLVQVILSRPIEALTPMEDMPPIEPEPAHYLPDSPAGHTHTLSPQESPIEPWQRWLSCSNSPVTRKHSLLPTSPSSAPTVYANAPVEKAATSQSHLLPHCP